MRNAPSLTQASNNIDISVHTAVVAAEEEDEEEHDIRHGVIQVGNINNLICTSKH